MLIGNTLALQVRVRGSIPLSSTKQFWSQSVHGRTIACHAIRRGSLPLGTANLEIVDEAQCIVNACKVFDLNFTFKYVANDNATNAINKT